MKGSKSASSKNSVESPPEIGEKIDLEGKSDNEIASKISRAYSEAKSSVDLAIRKVIICGLLLHTQKSKLKHGEFGRWLASNCPEISWKTACSWMKTARIACREMEVAPESTFDSVPLYEALQSPPSKLTPSAKDIRQKIFNFVDGRSQRSLTLSGRKIRETADSTSKKKNKDLPESIRSNSISLSKMEAKKLETQSKWKSIAHDLQNELQKKSFAFLDQPTLEEMHDLFKKTEAVLGELIKAQRKISS